MNFRGGAVDCFVVAAAAKVPASCCGVAVADGPLVVPLQAANEMTAWSIERNGWVVSVGWNRVVVAVFVDAATLWRENRQSKSDWDRLRCYRRIPLAVFSGPK